MHMSAIIWCVPFCSRSLHLLYCHAMCLLLSLSIFYIIVMQCVFFFSLSKCNMDKNRKDHSHPPPPLYYMCMYLPAGIHAVRKAEMQANCSFEKHGLCMQSSSSVCSHILHDITMAVCASTFCYITWHRLHADEATPR